MRNAGHLQYTVVWSPKGGKPEVLHAERLPVSSPGDALTEFVVTMVAGFSGVKGVDFGAAANKILEIAKRRNLDPGRMALNMISLGDAILRQKKG